MTFKGNQVEFFENTVSFVDCLAMDQKNGKTKPKNGQTDKNVVGKVGFVPLYSWDFGCISATQIN